MGGSGRNGFGSGSTFNNSCLRRQAAFGGGNVGGGGCSTRFGGGGRGRGSDGKWCWSSGWRRGHKESLDQIFTVFEDGKAE